MKGFSKKIIGVFFALVIAFIGLITIAQPSYAAEGDVARIIVAGGDSWEVNYWADDNKTDGVVAVTPLVEGLGSYTASVDFSDVLITDESETVLVDGVLPNLQMLGIEIVNGETNMPNNFINITSFKVDDGVSEELVDIATTGMYTNEEGDATGLTRLNLYNPWATPADGNRTLFGSANVSAQAVDPAAFVNIVSIEISFDVVEGVAYNTTPIAYLNYASSDWSVNHWYDGSDYSPVVATTTEVTAKNAQYTTSLDFTGLDAGMTQGVAFFDIEILNGELAYPGSFMQIDEVAINGTPVTLQSDTYTSSDNEFDTRTNLYNAWVPEFITVGRTVDATYDNISAIPVSADEFVDVETISVTFTLKDGLDIGSTPLPEGGTTAFLQFQNNAGDILYWNDGNTYDVTHNDAAVTGFGQYTVSLDFSTTTAGEIADILFLDLEIAGGELYFPYNTVIVDEVLINDVAVDISEIYTVPSGNDTRVNLYNEWTTTVDDTARLAEGGDAETASFTPLDITALTYPITDIEVTFTINRGELPEPEAPYEMPENFKAILMFASETGGWQRFDPELDLAGDTLITGDGTYTVYLDSTFGGGNNGTAVTGAAVTPQVFLIDIIDFGNAMKSVDNLDNDGVVTAEDFTVSVQVFIDGTEVSANSDRILYGDIEGNGRLRFELYNIYGTGTMDVPVVDPSLLVPATEIRVTFTISGSGIDLATGFGVTFDSDGGSAVAAQTVEDGATATEPADPTKDGYTFVEWQLDGSAYDFSTAVTADISLTAIWEMDEVIVDTFDVTFDSDGGSAVDTQTVDDGDMATEPTDPTKDGYTFVEWQLDGSAYDFSTAVTADTALTAVWEMDGTDGVVDRTGCDTGCGSEFGVQSVIFGGVMLTLIGSLVLFLVKKKY